MYLKHLIIKGHPILNDIELDLINPKTKKPYSIIAFVGENGCGKTTILKELFNYNKSKYIQKDLQNKALNVLFLRQGSLHSNAMREVRKLIDASDLYSPRNNDSFVSKATPNNGITINNSEQGLSLLKLLGDEEIYKLFKDNHIDEIYCSQAVSKVIDGKEHGYDITNYSSGQQEILLKLKDIRLMSLDTDCVLLDEPETSLHPRWQIDIVRLIRLMSKNEQGEYPQIFLATHSEKVLESLINDENALIVRLFKEEGTIKAETITEMDLRLPRPTFAELDYVVFHIPSLDYHDQLFSYFGSFFDKDTSTGIDLKIERKATRMLGKNNTDKYVKERFNAHFNKVYKTKMLPTYIRDFFHHPNDIEPPTEMELILSTKLMRDLIKFVKETGLKEIEESE